MNKLLFIILLSFIHLSLFAQKSQVILLKNGKLIDVHTGKIKKNTSILVEKDSIVAIGKFKKMDIPKDAQIIDCEGKWFSPGLIDAHIHLFQSGGLYTRPDVIDLRKHISYEEERAWIKDNLDDILRRYLRCGITTVIDPGGPMRNFDYRNEYQPKATAPNIFLAGPLISTYQPPAFRNIVDEPIIEVTNASVAKYLIARQVERGADFIKIWYIAYKGMSAESNYELVKATIDETHANQLKAAVHATELLTAKFALKAGADILVHSIRDYEIDDEFIQMLKKNQVTYVPTLTVSNNYFSTSGDFSRFTDLDFELSPPVPLGSFFDMFHLDEKYLFDGEKAWKKDMEAAYQKRDSVMRINLKRLHEAGINVATGTDAGNSGTFHASSYYTELAAMKAANFSNAELLKMSTINAAKTLGKENLYGSIETNKKADILVLNQNPLEDLNHLLDMEWMLHKGQLIQADTIIKNTPANLAQQQLNGYNARNIEAFLLPYSEEVEVYNFPNDLRYKGKDSMRKGYTTFFENQENLHCELKKRIVQGNMVIDQERVTGDNLKTPIEAVAIYIIENGKIAKVYFHR